MTRDRRTLRPGTGRRRWGDDGSRGADVPAADANSRAYALIQGRACAAVRWTRTQALLYGAVAAGFYGLLAWRPYETWVAASYVVAFVVFVALAIRAAGMVLAWRRDPSLAISAEDCRRLTADELPVYSVLVPLYREPEVIPDLLRALVALDYPVGKLDMQILLEPDDTATREALSRSDLPGHIRLTVSPGGLPRTKPRACNAGLALARGEFLVVYDAEDRPEPDQLRKAVVAYRNAPADVVCLQCRLAHYNSTQGLLAQWSAMEYLVWYRLVLPGLQRMGAPMPLGGTSNHFRTSALRALRGWDPYNVTEDCDLGVRIARRGWRTWLLQSTTWEEAATSLRDWFNQRSRWVKGYWQTWLVHSRCDGLRALGPYNSLHLFLTTGLATAMLWINPFCWLIIGAWCAIGWPLFDSHSTLSVAALALSLTLFAANGVFWLACMLACFLAQRADLVPAVLLAPLEWMLLSAAAWRGGRQLLTRPFHWEKTAHGLAVADATDRAGRHAALRWGLPAAAVAVLVGTLTLAAVFVVNRVHVQVESQRPRKATQRPPLFAAADYEAATTVDALADAGAWRLDGRPAPDARAARVRDRDGHPTLELDARFPGDIGITRSLSAAPDGIAGMGPDWSPWKALAVDVLAPPDAPEGLRVSAMARDEERLWHRNLSPQWLLPGQWTRVEFDLRPESRPWRAVGHGRPWNPLSARRLREFGLRFHGHTNYVGSIGVDRLRLVPWNANERQTRAVLRLANLLASAQSLPVHAKFEVSFDLAGDYGNPFDPKDVDVAGVFRTEGSEVRLPAFLRQDYDRRMENGRETLHPIGPPRWTLRFTPMRAGPHQYRIEAVTATGASTTNAWTGFTATAPAGDGFVRRSDAKPALLQFDSGRPYYPVGHNVCWPVDATRAYAYEFAPRADEGTYTYDRIFQRMRAAGENWVRLWMTPGWMGLEGPAEWDGYHGLGRYNLGNAWRLDYLLGLAEASGIRIQLTVHHHSEYAGYWTGNVYSRDMGGPCAKPGDLLSDSTARRLFKNRLRYLVARWGYSPNLLAWELWGEVNLLPGFDPAVSADWHQEMARYLKGADPWRHMVFTHCHNWQRGNELWALPEIDCVQGNGYIRPPNRTVDHVRNFRRYIAEVEPFGKPTLVAEYGGRSELGAPNADYLEAQLHSGLWASVVHPFAGTAMNWWWDWIDGRDLYRHFHAVARFVRDIDRIRNDYAPVSPTVFPTGSGLCAAGMQATDTAFCWVYHTNSFVTCSASETRGAQLAWTNLPPGPHLMEVWDTRTGEVVRRHPIADAAGAPIELPPFRGDVAVKIVRDEPAQGRPSDRPKTAIP